MGSAECYEQLQLAVVDKVLWHLHSQKMSDAVDDWCVIHICMQARRPVGAQQQLQL